MLLCFIRVTNIAGSWMRPRMPAEGKTQRKSNLKLHLFKVKKSYSSLETNLAPV